MEKMKELYAKVAGDPALQIKFAAIMKEAAETGEATKEKLTAFAKEAGYGVTLEEAHEYFKTLSEQDARKDGSLSDAELDMVAGGKSGVGIVNLVIGSIYFTGFGCAIGSISYEINYAIDKTSKRCSEFFE
jgi:predicted ribosomally synthesized peptide with nif11-like leader